MANNHLIMQNNKTWETLQRMIRECMKECFQLKGANKGSFPNNKWFGIDCRDARHQVKEKQNKGDYTTCIERKKYMRTTLRRKTHHSEVQQTKELRRNKATNPEEFWEDIKWKPNNEAYGITLEMMLEHYKRLYLEEKE